MKRYAVYHKLNNTTTLVERVDHEWQAEEAIEYDMAYRQEHSTWQIRRDQYNVVPIEVAYVVYIYIRMQRLTTFWTGGHVWQRTCEGTAWRVKYSKQMHEAYRYPTKAAAKRAIARNQLDRTSMGNVGIMEVDLD